MNTQTHSAASGDSFAALFEASLKDGEFRKEGEVTQGIVVELRGRNVIIDVGGKSEGILPVSDFTDASGEVTVKPGDTVEVYIVARENDEGLVTLSKEWADRKRVWEELEKAFAAEEIIEGTIIERVKGGLNVKIRGGIIAFLPGSQVDLRQIRNLDKLIGQTYQFLILKCNDKRRNIVLSRRKLLEVERKEIKSKTLEILEEGKMVKGTIKNITDYGAFVDLGGIDGLLHITDMSWGRVNHPSEVFQVGQEVTVKILKYNPEAERVSLGYKQTQDDPWGHAVEAFPPGKKVKGKVMSIADYGAFIELLPGIEGLVHVSEMSWTKKIKHPSKVLEIGQEIECQVLEVDAKSKRISLGMKQLEPDPWTVFTEKYRPGQVIEGKVRSITDYGVFVGVEDGVDGMVHKSDLSWTVKINNPAEFIDKGVDVKAIILSINHDEKKVSLGIKQLFDDPWPTMFTEYPSGKAVEAMVLMAAEHGLYCRIRDGVDGYIPPSDVALKEDGTSYVAGDTIKAEIANIDAQDRRLTLSMKFGEMTPTKMQGDKRESKAPKKASDGESKGNTIGELIKQKLGEKLLDKKED